MRTTLSLSRRYLSLVLCALVVFNFRRSALINCALFSAISLDRERLRGALSAAIFQHCGGDFFIISYAHGSMLAP
jgi:hypothetical protein